MNRGGEPGVMAEKAPGWGGVPGACMFVLRACMPQFYAPALELKVMTVCVFPLGVPFLKAFRVSFDIFYPRGKPNRSSRCSQR